MIIDTTQTKITNEVMTLITDKIEKHCFLVSSHWPKSPEHHTWDFDRIARLIYNKMVGPDESYDHSISVRWKKPKGKGESDPGILKDIYIEHEGVYYAPCAFGFHIHLWHPDKQELQESAPLSQSSERVCWRPIYEYNEDEVWSALQILCEHYGWDLKKGEDRKWITHTCGSGTIVYG